MSCFAVEDKTLLFLILFPTSSADDFLLSLSVRHPVHDNITRRQMREDTPREGNSNAAS